jgi:Fe-S oxidoreductase
MVPGKALTFPGWEDSAAPPERFGEYLRAIDGLFHEYGYDADLYGHFGQGVLHCRVDFGLLTTPGIEKFRRFLDQAADLVVSMGGSLSGEHGDGQARADLLPRMFGAQIVEAFNDFKRAWDPAGGMNPGKLVHPNDITADVRVSPQLFDPPKVGTHFGFADDKGSFAHVAMRCVGVGDCRKDGDGTMCPSYMVTREEKYSTRGRARMLFEMMQGSVVTSGWRSDEVKDALDLCLACKACKSECPVNVDMATYKAEFLSHYWAGRLRPRQAYVFGLMPWWLRLGARAPRLANFATSAKGLSSVAKMVAGIAPQRRIPPLATETFSEWFRRRAPYERPAPRAGQQERRVILWPDTFTDHFHPGSARSAVEVLEAAGWQVELPPGWVCCGRPLYDFGFIGQARRLLRQAMHTLGPALRDGVPIVGLEPSCVAAFRDELVELNPDLPQAKRLHDSTFLLTEFLTKVDTGYKPPQMSGKAVVHGHCQQKAVLDMDAEIDLLRATGLDLDFLDSGCCGMAGNFGFEAGTKYDVSVAAGERVLLPAVRAADPAAYIVATGFSCREQIAQLTDRQAIHPADLLAAGLRGTDRLNHQSASDRKEG